MMTFSQFYKPTSAEYQQGYAAYKTGQANPYPLGWASWREFSDGWGAAQQADLALKKAAEEHAAELEAAGPTLKVWLLSEPCRIGFGIEEWCGERGIAYYAYQEDEACIVLAESEADARSVAAMRGGSVSTVAEWWLYPELTDCNELDLKTDTARYIIGGKRWD